MYKAVLTLLLIGCSIASFSQTQTEEEKAAYKREEKIATKLVQRLLDSLDLNELQRQNVIAKTVQIQREKQQIRSTYFESDSLDIHLELYKAKEDSLYQVIIPAEKFQIYLKKKRMFLN